MNRKERRLKAKTAVKSGENIEQQWSIALQLAHQGRIDQSISAFQQVLKIDPQNVDGHYNLGFLYLGQGKLKNAIKSCQRAIAIKPDHFDAHNTLGNALQACEQLDDAVVCFEQVVGLRPGYAPAHYNLGNALRQTGRLDDAVTSYRKAISLQSDHAGAHGNLGLALQQLGLLDAAVESFQAALDFNPNIAELHSNFGIALHNQGRLDDAIASFHKALDINPDFAEAHCNLGVSLTLQGRVPDAVDCFKMAITLKPDCTEALVQFIHQSKQIGRWHELEEPLQRLRRKLKRDASDIDPFMLLTVCDDPKALLLCAKEYSAKVERLARREAPNLNFRYDWPTHNKLRVGYLSADFRAHATAYLMVQMFENHDKKRVETFAYSYGPDDASPMRKRLVGAFDHFHDVRLERFSETAKRINGDEIDILIDLKGYTRDARTKIVSLRPAPLQINYLGYPGSMGADFIDYIIADRFLVPEKLERHYSEKIIFMPGSYQVNDSTRQIAPETGTRSDHGLPEKGFVFCSFNQAAKISPQMFSIWMRLLKQVEGSVLWLLAFNAYTEKNLMEEAASFGISPERIIFAPKMPLDEHLARYKLADLFLDTFPYNAHTTASDALWGGCPIVTCSGETFASRVAGSLMSALDVEGMIANSFSDYEALALKLARNPETLMEIRLLLETDRVSSRVFDGAEFAKNLEYAFESIWKRYSEGLDVANLELQEA
jgi:protein O-GlcNAc transferase